MKDHIHMRIRSIRGFSLVEMAIVIVIITLLLGAVLVPLGTQMEQRNIASTQQSLDEIKEALIGFAIAKGRLPCPDINDDGVADPDLASACTQYFGNVPWQTLGVRATDAWDNHFRYQVTAASGSAYTTSLALPPAIGDGDLYVCASATGVTSTDCGSSSNTLASKAIVVFYSLGSNGAQWLNGNIVPTSPDEQENANLVSNTNHVFVSHTKSESGSSAGAYDDIVTWLSPYVLFNRMVAAGKLP